MPSVMPALTGQAPKEGRLEGGRLPALAGRTLGVALALAAAAALTALALNQLLAAAAVLYVAAFWLVASRFPAVALMLIFAVAPFQNDLSGGGGAKFSLAEVNLALTLPLLYLRGLVQRQRPRVGPILIPVLLYFAVCLFSSLIHWLGQTALISLFQMLLYLVVAVGVFRAFPADPRQYWLGFNALVVVGVFLAVAGMATGYWFIGLNKNGIADSLTCCLLVGVELILSSPSPRRRQVLGAALLVIGAGLLFSLSRGAWLGTISGVVFIFAMRGQLPRLLRVALPLLPLLALFWYALPPASQDYTTGFGREHYNINLRYQSIDLAEAYFHQSPLYGMGVGLRKDYDATNVLLMTLAETGVLGCLGFLLIHAAFFRMVWRARARTAPTDLAFSLLCIGGALVLNKFVHGLVDHYWSRGALMATWAAAGMATRAYDLSRGRPLVRTGRAGRARQGPRALAEGWALKGQKE